MKIVRNNYFFSLEKKSRILRMYILRTPYPHIYYKRSVSMKITTKQVGARMREARKRRSTLYVI